jgi:DNA-binding response OmpR family regulator
MSNNGHNDLGINGQLTKTEEAILVMLSDGLSHTRKELMGCLWDELAGRGALQVHILNLRKKLPAGEAIVCTARGRTFGYQHVRLLCNPYDGKY